MKPFCGTKTRSSRAVPQSFRTEKLVFGAEESFLHTKKSFSGVGFWAEMAKTGQNRMFSLTRLRPPSPIGWERDGVKVSNDPTINSQQSTLNQLQIMAKLNYVAANDVAFSAQLNVFKNNIGGYGTTVGVTAPQITAQAADANYFAYILQCQEAMQNGAQQWTSWKDLTRGGGAPPVSARSGCPHVSNGGGRRGAGCRSAFPRTG